MLMVNLINHITDSKTTPFSINPFFINFSDFLLENWNCWENQVTFCFCMRFKHMAFKFMKGKIFYYVIIVYIGVSLFFTKPPLKSANSPSLWSKSTFWVNPFLWQAKAFSLNISDLSLLGTFNLQNESLKIGEIWSAWDKFSPLTISFNCIILAPRTIVCRCVGPCFLLEGWTSYQIFKKGRFEWISIFRGGLTGKRWKVFFNRRTKWFKIGFFL